MAAGFGVLHDVVMEHLDQSIAASVGPEHRHALRTELRRAESHVNGLVEALRQSPEAPEPEAQLEKALAEAGHPQPGRVDEWLHSITRWLHTDSSSGDSPGRDTGV